MCVISQIFRINHDIVRSMPYNIGVASILYSSVKPSAMHPQVMYLFLLIQNSQILRFKGETLSQASTQLRSKSNNLGT